MNRSDPNNWIKDWLDRAAESGSTMSQRVLSEVEKHGGLAAAKREARRRNLHLLVVTDEHGREVVVANRNPFRVVC